MSKSSKNDEKNLAQPLLGGNGEGAADASSETGSDFHLAATYMGVDKATLLNTGAEGLSSAEAEQRLLKFGKNELEEKKKNPWIELLKTFIAPIPIMIWIAILVEFIEALTKDSQEYADVAVLLILQFLNSIIGWYEELKAGNAIEALKKSLLKFITSLNSVSRARSVCPALVMRAQGRAIGAFRRRDSKCE